MKIEQGQLVIKGSEAWGITYEEGNSRSYGWISIENAELYSDRVKNPEDVVWKGSSYREELKTGKLVKVKRVTTIQFDM